MILGSSDYNLFYLEQAINQLIDRDISKMPRVLVSEVDTQFMSIHAHLQD